MPSLTFLAAVEDPGAAAGPRRALRAGARLTCVAILLAGAAVACSSRPSPSDEDSSRASRYAELTREQALANARTFVVAQGAAAQVYLDSAAVVDVDPIWRVTFRRRAIGAPFVLTVDVHRHTGAMRFPGDE